MYRTLKPALATTAIALALAAGNAGAADKTKLRIQTHFSPETLSGQMAAEFIEDITAMSNNEIEVEMFYSGAVVKAAETFDACLLYTSPSPRDRG